MVHVPHDCITSENEANGETDTCTSKCTNPASGTMDEQKIRLSAGLINQIRKGRCEGSEAAERNPHFTVRTTNNALGFAFDSRDLRGMNVISTYFCRR